MLVVGMPSAEISSSAALCRKRSGNHSWGFLYISGLWLTKVFGASAKLPFLRRYALPSTTITVSANKSRGVILCACIRRVSLKPELSSSDFVRFLKSKALRFGEDGEDV